MSSPAPALVISEITERLNALIFEERPSEFVLASLKQKAKQLVRISGQHAHGYQALGMIASLEFDATATVAAFENALHFSNDSVIRNNYIVAIDRLGMYEKAAAMAVDFADSRPDDLEALELALRQCLFALRFSKAMEFHGAYKRLRGVGPVGPPAVSTHDTVDLGLALEFEGRMFAAGVPAISLVTLAETAAEVLGRNRVRNHGVRLGFVPGGSLAYMIAVGRDVTTIVDLNMEIADSIVAKADTYSDLCTFSCTPLAP